MVKPLEIDRSKFDQYGFTIVPDVILSDEIAVAASIFEERLPPDKSPPGVPGDNLNGRKTLISDYTDPRLSNLAGHPRLITAVEQLLGPLFLIHTTSAPVITYKSPPGGENFELGYHVDWPNNPPKIHDNRHINCAVHFSGVEPAGGALMVRPGSHRFVEKNLDNPKLRQRMLDQDFNDLPDLTDPLEVCVDAGSAVFFHAFLVHDRSENVLDTPRKVLFTHYKGFDNRQQRSEWAANAMDRFAKHQIATMDDRLKQLCGLDGKG